MPDLNGDEKNGQDRLRRADARDASNLQIGAFVTNKWLVGTLILLLMSMGGYIFKGIDKGSDAMATQLSSLDRRLSATEISNAKNEVQYQEILRRLDNIERVLYTRTH